MLLETKDELDIKMNQIESQILLDSKEEFEKLNNRFDSLENRFDKINNRFDSLENRFDNIEKLLLQSFRQ